MADEEDLGLDRNSLARAPRQPSNAERGWEEKTLKATLAASPERAADFTTVSSYPIRPLYTEADLAGWSPERDLGSPGEPPYTRGIHPTMYRSRLWTMRQFAGFGTAQDTNRRFRYLLAQGQTGLSVAFDLPTLMGYDSDHAMSEGEVGKCGVAISSLADMEALFDQIPLGDITTSMTINSPAAAIWAMYLAVAEKQGADWRKLSGTLQNDILKEYIAQKEYIYPPEPSMRMVTDTIEFGAKHTPKFNPISISGYHIREAGSTAIQELAFTLRDGIEYVEHSLRRGLQIDDFAPRLSFFFNAHNDFFEEIAKYRAARRIWQRVMRERFAAKNPRSWALRFHAQTAGCSLTAQQPYNNVVRTAVQALAAVLGGTQSLHTNSLDEAWALPDRIRRDHRPAHAADSCIRKRRHEYRRPVRRIVFRRDADERNRARRVGLHREDRRNWRNGGCHRAGLPAAGDRRRGVSLPGGGRSQGKDHRGRECLRHR